MCLYSTPSSWVLAMPNFGIFIKYWAMFYMCVSILWMHLRVLKKKMENVAKVVGGVERISIMAWLGSRLFYQTGVGAFRWPLVHGLPRDITTCVPVRILPRHCRDRAFINADPKLWNGTWSQLWWTAEHICVVYNLLRDSQGIPRFIFKRID